MEAKKNWFQSILSKFTFSNMPEEEIITFDIENKEDRKQFIETICLEIEMANKEIKKVKDELSQVQELLSDYQKIESFPESIKNQIKDIGLEILDNRDNRAKFKEAMNIDPRVLQIEEYEDEIEDLIDKIKALEEKQLLIKKDLEHLEAEKAEIQYQRNKIITTRQVLKTLTIAFFTFFSIVLIILTTLATIYDKDVLLPSIVLLTIGLFFVLYLYNYRGKSIYKLKRNERLHKKANDLVKKIQIKFVNNTSFLEYEYNKFKVNSHVELKYLYDKYKKQKEEKQVYKHAASALDRLEQEIIDLLEDKYIQNPQEIAKQVAILTNDKERKEYIDHLTGFTNQLKEQLNNNKETIHSAKNRIKALMLHNHSLENEIKEIIESKNVKI
ncbi:hypothetical protein EDC19_2184 [Natranaerovirga hydrolytica]|uniref:Uncharacterized protein n=1 Tax=Natranaerovirga hydrolytica TaxID=680378 RepID=A0A4R1MPN1_9FIRM|nr:hypothetical protein [Natranaerovirga hydrolytica]TCK92449.1 hypothetical protein EDC19_2184 [Natranaerovirga hydrolytica]